MMSAGLSCFDVYQLYKAFMLVNLDSSCSNINSLLAFAIVKEVKTTVRATNSVTLRHIQEKRKR